MVGLRGDTAWTKILTATSHCNTTSASRMTSSWLEIKSQSFRKIILEKFHLANQGVQRTKAKARKVLHWPGMARDIEMTVEKCMQCQQCQPQQQKEPLITHEIPELLWIKVGADIFKLKGQSYLLLVDYLTKYP